MNTLFSIQSHEVRKSLIDVRILKGNAERWITIDRTDYEAWIERTDRNQFPFEYFNGETTVCVPATCLMSEYWNEVNTVRKEGHLYDFIVLHSLHYDEVLAKTHGKPYRENNTMSVIEDEKVNYSPITA